VLFNSAWATSNGPRSIYKTVNSGGSFGSSPLRQEIGLGNATAITSVEITWPASGVSQNLAGLKLDHAYRIRENNSQPLSIDLKRIQFDLTSQQSSHHHSGTKAPSPPRSGS